MTRGFKKFSSVLATGIVAAAACAPVASADTVLPTWNCRASVAYVQNTILPIPDLSRIEPLPANGDPLNGAPDRAQCAHDYQAVPHINIGGAQPANFTLDADAVAASTDLTPQLGTARNQTTEGHVKTAKVDLNLGASAIHLQIDAVTSDAIARCVDGKPRLEGASAVVGLRINNVPVPLEDILSALADALAPLDPLVRITLNEQVRTGDENTDSESLRQTALRIELLNFGGPSGITIVLGETKATRQGRTCDGTDAPAPPAPPQNPPNTPPTGNTGPSGPTNPSVVFVPIQVPVSTPSSTTTTTVEVNGTNGGCGTIKMYFDKNRAKTFSSTFGQRVVTRGRLINCSGKPIIGGRVDVYHLVRGKTKRLRKTGVRSREHGYVTLILPLNLTSRKIYFEYRGNLASSKVNSRSTLNLTVRDKTGKIISKLPPGQPKPHF